MKVCPDCNEEYEDRVETCEDCKVPLVDQDLARAKKVQEARKMSETLRFVPAAIAEDPFDAEAYVAAVEAKEIPVLSRPRRQSAVDKLVTSGNHVFWEIVVPENRLQEARDAIEVRKAELASSEDDASKAAEEEEAASEGYEVVAESPDEEAAKGWAGQLGEAGIPTILRPHSEVELDPAEAVGPDRTLVMVPQESRWSGRG